MAYYRRVKCTNCFSTNLTVYDGFFTQTLQCSRILFFINHLSLWNEFVMHQTTNIEENNEHHIDFWASLAWFFRFRLVFCPPFWWHFTCQILRPMSRYQFCCVPWMWDQNWRDPECQKRPAYVTVFEENSAFWNKPCSDTSHAQNIHQNRTDKLVRDVKVMSYLSLTGLTIIEHNFLHFFHVFIGWRVRRSSRTRHVFYDLSALLERFIPLVRPCFW